MDCQKFCRILRKDFFQSCNFHLGESRDLSSYVSTRILVSSGFEVASELLQSVSFASFFRRNLKTKYYTPQINFWWLHTLPCFNSLVICKLIITCQGQSMSVKGEKFRCSKKIPRSSFPSFGAGHLAFQVVEKWHLEWTTHSGSTLLSFQILA